MFTEFVFQIITSVTSVISAKTFQLSNKRSIFGWSFTEQAIHRGKVTHRHPLNKYSGHISVFTWTWPTVYCPIFTYGTRGRLSKTVARDPLLRPRTCNWDKTRAPNATLSRPTHHELKQASARGARWSDSRARRTIDRMSSPS